MTVTLKPTAYAYGTRDYVVTSDINGKYDIKQISRYVYSSGSAPKWVSYYLSVSAPGYDNYTGSTFDFQNSTTIKIDIKLTAQNRHWDGNH